MSGVKLGSLRRNSVEVNNRSFFNFMEQTFISRFARALGDMNSFHCLTPCLFTIHIRVKFLAFKRSCSL
jgi:hypothetical protein